jgi:hypothetical protein
MENGWIEATRRNSTILHYLFKPAHLFTCTERTKYTGRDESLWSGGGGDNGIVAKRENITFTTHDFYDLHYLLTT